jgi:uncharacterized protein
MRVLKSLGFLSLFLVCGHLAFAATTYPEHPSTSGLVNDFAGIMSASDAGSLEHDLRAFEESTKVEIAVVTVTSLNGDSVEDYSNGLFRAWGIGKKGADNGILLIISTSDKKVRIEAGRRMEEILTDADSKIIISNVIIPTYRSGDRSKAIVDGAHAIMDKLSVGLKTDGSQIMSHATTESYTAIYVLIGTIFFGLLIFGWIVVRKLRRNNESEYAYVGGGEYSSSRSSSPRSHNSDSDFVTGVAVGSALSSNDDDDRRSSNDNSTSDTSSSFDFGGGDSGGGGASGDL